MRRGAGCRSSIRSGFAPPSFAACPALPACRLLARVLVRAGSGYAAFLVDRVPPEAAAAGRVTPVEFAREAEAQMRFEAIVLWRDILLEPSPPARDPYATGIWHYARALAQLGEGRRDRAESEFAQLTAIRNHEAFRTTLKDSPFPNNLEIASRIVGAELAAQASRTDEAVRLLTEAVALEDAIPYNEPPVWHHPTRQVLGAVLLEAGRPAEAERVYRDDLVRVRENGWSLFGLMRSLELQGRSADAAAVGGRFERAWKRADVVLTSSRMRPAEAGQR